MKRLTFIVLIFILATAGCFAQNDKIELKVKKAGTLGTLLTGKVE